MPDYHLEIKITLSMKSTGTSTAVFQESRMITLLHSGRVKFLEWHHPNFGMVQLKPIKISLIRKRVLMILLILFINITKHNRDILIKKGTKGSYQIKASYNGAENMIGFKNVRIGQFYPNKIKMKAGENKCLYLNHI